MSETPDLNRRGFLTTIARGAALGTLGVLAGAVSAPRSKADGHAGETCARQGICRGCPTFEDCGLPQALSKRGTMNDER